MTSLSIKRKAVCEQDIDEEGNDDGGDDDVDGDDKNDFDQSFACVTRGVLYTLIKCANLDPRMLYRVFTFLFDSFCFGKILQPVIGLSSLGGRLVEVMEGQNGEEAERYGRWEY